LIEEKRRVLASPNGRSDVWLPRGLVGGNSLNNFANLHVIMAIRNTEFFEVLLPDAMQKYGLVEDIAPDKDGMVHAPTGPGLGASIDFDLIERKKVGVLS
jgi:L-alanine-DL-glutamate epimerase-like enolase superfamily enzyme